MKKTGLGKGIQALFNTEGQNLFENDNNSNNEINSNINNVNNNNIETDSDTVGLIKEIKLVDIVPNREQARKVFDSDKLTELANSIKTFGVIQPIIVSKTDDYYTIVAGERRWRASKIAGLKTIPAIINEDSEKKKEQISLLENLQRENLNPVEKARGLDALMKKYNMSVAQLSEILGIHLASIYQSLKILDIEEDILDLLQNSNLSESGCLAVLEAETYEQRKEVALYMIEDGLTAKEAFRRLNIVKKAKKKDPEYLPIFKKIEDTFESYFGNKVKLQVSNRHHNRGKIIISYSSNDDLERMLNLLDNNIDL